MKTASIIQERLERVQGLPLMKGGHSPPNGVAEFCVMEAVAYVAGEKHSADPECACPVIASFLRSWNDVLSGDDRTRLLKPLIPSLVNTRRGKKVERRREWMILDWLVRELTPGFLNCAGLKVEASALRSVAELVDVKSCETAMRALTAAKEKAAAARAATWAAARDATRDAAWDAARAATRAAARAAARAATWAAARDAAGDAAWDAARDAARAATRAAARAAAWDAAWAAARDAAGDAAKQRLAPTVANLQASAVKLVERLCEVK